MTKKSVIKIQPVSLTSSKPYPFFIEEDGSVQRQDFWGDLGISNLIGFSKTKDRCTLSLPLTKFLKKISAAVGMYPVFTSMKMGSRGKEVATFCLRIGEVKRIG